MKHLAAAALAALAAVVFTTAALADGGKYTLGPTGYNGPGNKTLIVAGTAGVVLGSDDHVVICHAIGGPNGTDFNEIAPSASGVLNGHGSHQGDRDIIPPYTFRDNKGGTDTSLASGNNWNSATAAIYGNGCRLPATPPPPTDVCPNIPGAQSTVPAGMTKDASGNCVTPPNPPTDVCPNIEGIQTSIPSGMTKDASGNCVTPPNPPTDACPNIEGMQTSIPSGMIKDASGNCITPPLVPSPPTTNTVEIDKVVVSTVVVKCTCPTTTAKTVVKKKAKKVIKKKAKVKKAKIKVKAAHKTFKSHVLPHTR